MSNIIIKKVLILCAAAALFASLETFAKQTPYCIRIYCSKNPSAKVTGEGGHGKFFPAFLDDATNTFYVQPNQLDVVAGKCGRLQLYWGTSAHLFESIAPWKEVK